MIPGLEIPELTEDLLEEPVRKILTNYSTQSYIEFPLNVSCCEPEVVFGGKIPTI